MDYCARVYGVLFVAETEAEVHEAVRRYLEDHPRLLPISYVVARMRRG